MHPLTPDPPSLCAQRHLRLYDSEFRPLQAAQAFARARMRTADEIKDRHKLLHLSFVDFLEALVRIAVMKRMPTDEMIARAGTKTVGEFFAKLRGAGMAEHKKFVTQHKEHCVAVNDEVGQLVSVALDKLLSSVMYFIADRLDMLKAGPGALTRQNINDFYSAEGGFKKDTQPQDQSED